MAASLLNRVLLSVAAALGLAGLLAGVVIPGLVGDLLRAVFFTAAALVAVVAIVARRGVSKGG
jgi:hypothetical protein